MIKLKLLFKEDETHREFEITDGELLLEAVDRVLKEVPSTEENQEKKDLFNVTVNGMFIERDFYSFTKLKSTDVVVLSPRIQGGEFGQIFKQIAVIAITVVATYFLGPAGYGLTGAGLAAATAAVSIAAGLLMNALIPPMAPDLGGNFGRSAESSQMYSISGQSNEIRRYATVPKVYGTARIFPNVAAMPYVELSVDPETGKTIQYMYAIYDFGLGTMLLRDLKIGETPLDTESFQDFEYRLVDVNLPPEPNQDEYDQGIYNQFELYKGRRASEQLSFSMSDGNEIVQVADTNTKNEKQELILDFTCPQGLFGYLSNGSFGKRTIRLEIEFALVGTDDWMAYNDLNYVDSYEQIGGNDLTTATLPGATDGVNQTYYTVSISTNKGSNYSSTSNLRNSVATANIRFGQKKILVQNNDRWQIGAKVWLGKHFIGIVNSMSAVGSNTEITLDRNITWPTGAFLRDNAKWINNLGYVVECRRFISGGTYYDPTYSVDSFSAPKNLINYKVNSHELSVAQITGSSQQPVYGHVRFTPKVIGSYKIRVRRASTSGSYSKQKSDFLTWNSITTAYAGQPITTTKRHLFLELKIRATNQLNGQIQNLSGVVSSVIPVYNPESGSWVRMPTSNPAWIFADLMCGEVNKKSIPNSRLHIQSLIDWANFCYEIPTPPPGMDYVDSRFQCNFILDYQATLQDVLNSVTSMGQAQMNVIDGKYGVFIDRYKDVPVQIFTTRNSKDFSSNRNYSPQPHGVKVSFIDPQMNWNNNEIIAYDNGYNFDNATDIHDLTAFGCTNAEQAWRYGRYMLAQNRYRQETISITVDFEHLICTRGDYVQIAQDVMRVGGRPARVKTVVGDVITIDDAIDYNPSISYGYNYRSSSTGEIKTSTLTFVDSRTFELDGDIPEVDDLIVIGEVGKIVFDCIVKSISPNDDLSAQLTLVERSNEIFNYESTDVFPEYDPQISQTTDPNYTPPAAVTNLQVTDNYWDCNAAGNGYDYLVELLWDIPVGSVYEFFEIWVNEGNGYKVTGTTTSKLYRYTVTPENLGVEHGFKVVAVASSGNKLQLVAMPEVKTTPTAKITNPSDVSFLAMQITNQILQLSWETINDCDIKEYQLRYSPDTNDVWESSVPLAYIDKNTSAISIQARTGIYLIKAIDFNGNQSTSPAEAMTTIPNLFDLNIIEVMNEAPDFEGTLVDTVLLGEAVILTEATPGDATSVVYTEEGYYEYAQLLDLDDIYTVRLQSNIRADGFKKGEMMSDWLHLEDVIHLSTVITDEWDVALQYRATEIFASMADWDHLYEVDHLNFGAGEGWTEWRDIPTLGDATGRIFQFRTKLQSLAPNVTPRLFDATVKADMPDRLDSFENLTSHPTEATEVVYDPVFKGPGSSPNVQISVDNAESGDTWQFDYKNLEGFAIRFYDVNGTQVSRQFDVAVKGYGRRHTVTL